jgi:hypothetical protein
MNLRDDDEYISEYLDIAEQQFESGHKAVLLMALHQCLLLNKPLPEWLRKAFIKAYEYAMGFEAKSWDDVFGRPHPKGAHLETRRQHRDLRIPIWLRV